MYSIYISFFLSGLLHRHFYAQNFNLWSIHTYSEDDVLQLIFVHFSGFPGNMIAIFLRALGEHFLWHSGDIYRHVQMIVRIGVRLVFYSTYQTLHTLSSAWRNGENRVTRALSHGNRHDTCWCLFSLVSPPCNVVHSWQYSNSFFCKLHDELFCQCRTCLLSRVHSRSSQVIHLHICLILTQTSQRFLPPSLKSLYLLFVSELLV